MIYSKTIEEHEVHIKKALDKLKEQNKCKFYYSQIKFLGYAIGEGGIKTDLDKIESVKNWTIPDTTAGYEFHRSHGFLQRVY